MSTAPNDVRSGDEISDRKSGRSWFRDQQNFPEERLFPDGGRRSAMGGGFGSSSGASPKAKSGKGGKAAKKGGKAAKKR